MRRSKESILFCLEKEPLDAVLAAVRQWPPRGMVSPLIGCLFHGDERIKWHAVSALGAVVVDLAESDREAARAVVRRLMWSLNDESGSIGWGAPEALAEIMAGHEGLTGEYGHILVSYMRPRPEGCYLELPALQRGLIWGMGRMAGVWPGLLREADAPVYLRPYLDSEDAEVRGLAARALGLLRVETAGGRLASMGGDTAEFLLYDRGDLATVTVAGLAAEALALIG